MRGLVVGLGTPHPLGSSLPAVYHDDDFAQRFLSGLDVVLAPVISTLDNLEAYLDPRLAPDDFLDWLATWVGISLDETWESARRRETVARAADLFRMRGTAVGLAEQVRIQTGGHAEIVENGATSWSVDPGGELPGSDEPALLVRVTVPDPRAVDARRLDALIAASKPAHVPHVIEIIRSGGRRSAEPARTSGTAASGDAGAGDAGAGDAGAGGATSGDEPPGGETATGDDATAQ